MDARWMPGGCWAAAGWLSGVYQAVAGWMLVLGACRLTTVHCKNCYHDPYYHRHGNATTTTTTAAPPA